MKQIYVILVLILPLFSSCDDYVPKPTGYPRIERKDTLHLRYENSYFSFMHVSQTNIEIVEKEAESSFWFNLLYPAYDARIYCTYISMAEKEIPKALEDSYQLAFSQSLKANGIGQSLFTDSINRNIGIVYNIKGSVATPLQFYITDSKRNFLRGSLYFDQVVNPDSVAPVVSFIRDDVRLLMETIDWKNNR